MAKQHGLPPGFRFVPTDEELIELCLLPRIQHQPLLPNDIIEDDPLSAPPWALLEKHGRRHQAFFFAACQAMNARGGRQKRTCEGHGTWQGQGKRKRGKEEDEGQEVKQKKLRVSVRGHAEKTEIEWDKYALNFHERGVQGSSGWVMHEYSITAPPELAQSLERVYCIRFSGHGRNAKKNSRDAQHRGDDEFDDDEEEVDDEAAGAIATTATCGAADEDPAALFFDEYPPPAPQLEHDASFPVMVPDAVNPSPADQNLDLPADQDLDLPGLVDYDDSSIVRNAKKLRRDAQHWCSDDVFEDDDEEVDDVAGAMATNTTWSAAEEDAALLIEEYLPAFPLVEVDVVSANSADGAAAGAGYDQDLPALVDQGSFVFMNSLPDLAPDVDFSQWDDLYLDA